MFYYYNPKEFPLYPEIGGNHEGDWEWIQIRLTSKNVPISVAASQHGAGEKCGWGPDVGVSGGGHPIIYVAYESHANYFGAGIQRIQGEETKFPVVSDTTSDDGALYREVPGIVDFTTSSPQWIADWDGFWGASSRSPKTPGKQPNDNGAPWTEAFTWDDNAGSCTSAAFSLRAVLAPSARTSTGDAGSSMRTSNQGAKPPLPRILSVRVVAGTRYGKAIRVRYCFRSLSSNPLRRPWRLHLTVENLRDKLPPLTVPWRVKTRCALVTQPVGGIKPPYLLRYSVESRQGTWSKQATMPVR